MKIDNTIKGVTAPRARETKPERVKARPQQAGRTTVSDEVKITDNSTRLQQLEARLVDIEITDPAKVESIRQAIADGTFQVDEEAVAEGLVRESLENLSHQAKQ